MSYAGGAYVKIVSVVSMGPKCVLFARHPRPRVTVPSLFHCVCCSAVKDSSVSLSLPIKTIEKTPDIFV